MEQYTPILFSFSPEALGNPVCQAVSLATRLGLSGNLWQSYLTWELLHHQNPWSLACEGRGDQGGSLSRLALRDLTWVRELFARGPEGADPDLRELLLDYDRGDLPPTAAGEKLSRLRDDLAAAPDAPAFAARLALAYRELGVGDLALHNAFRLDERGGLLPVSSVKEFSLRDLVGYELQKEQLTANTLAFLAGRPSNNVLLYGDAGTGKSTSVRSLLTDFAGTSLRLVELSTPELEKLAPLMASLRERNYRFILFIDDLSFEEHETGYKHLKAVIEGGLETMPDNVRIYATSNRRHLIKETWKDKADMEHDGDIHRSDTVEEKLSLAARFGVAINFPSPRRREYHDIVLTLARKQLDTLPDQEQLLRDADRWEIRHGGITGRTAQQFVDYLAGQKEPS